MKTEINQEEKWRKLLTDYKTANKTIVSVKYPHVKKGATTTEIQ